MGSILFGSMTYAYAVTYAPRTSAPISAATSRSKIRGSPRKPRADLIFPGDNIDRDRPECAARAVGLRPAASLLLGSPAWSGVGLWTIPTRGGRAAAKPRCDQ